MKWGESQECSSAAWFEMQAVRTNLREILNVADWNREQEVRLAMVGHLSVC